MSQAGFSNTIIRIQTGTTVDSAVLNLSRKATVTQLVPALPSFSAIALDTSKSQAAIELVMAYIENCDFADLEVGIDALVIAYEQSTKEQPHFKLTLEEAWVIARECRCLGSAEVLNLLFSSFNQEC